MRGITKYFIQHPTLVNLCILLLVGIGGLQLYQIQRTNFPKQKIRFIDVSVPYPGATPSEVEEGITVKIEDNLEGISGIDRVTSASNESSATISVELEEYADANVVLTEVKNAVDKVNTFPDGIEPPIVEKREVMDITVSFGLMGEAPLATMKDVAKEIENDLLAFKGISQVFIEGVPEEEIEIQVRENDLRTYQLTFNQVVRAVSTANLETFGGEIETGKENINIKAQNKGYYAKDLQHIIVAANRDGNTIRLKDVADVRDRFADAPTARYFEGEKIVVVNVYTLPEEDILENAEVVKNYIQNFNAEREGLQLKILEDGTVNLNNRIQTMASSGIMGMILVLLVLALFLDRHLALWVALKIPIAIVGMFIMADLYGMTINVVSLFGFILVLGILVDDGVVIGENIYQHAKEKGKNPLKAALDGTHEMVVPVIISLTTTAVAFSLFMFLPTQAGEFFGEVAFVVIAVLIVALVESLFFLPTHLAHSKGLTGQSSQSKIERWFNKGLLYVREKLYMPTFHKAVLGKKWVLGLTFLAFIGILIGTVSMIPAGIVSTTFFPNLDDDAGFIELELPPGTPVEITQQQLQKIEDATWQVNENYTAQRKDDQQVVQFVEQITGPLPNQGQLKVTFLNGEERGISSFELFGAIREATPPIPEASSLVYGLGATTAVFGKPISFALQSSNLSELRQAKEALKEEMRQMDEVKDVSDNDQAGIREINIRLKPQAELLGLSLAEVMAQVRMGFFGIEAQSLQRKDEEVKIWVRYPEVGRKSVDQLMDMRIRTPQGQYPLKEIADLDYQRGTLTINHIEGKREIRVEANVANANVSAPAAIGQIEKEILTPILAQYPSVDYSIEGQNRQSFKLSAAIQTVGPIVLLFIFALIVVNCNSFSQAVLVFSLFPFALIGVIWGHWAHNIALNLFSGIGTIALIGVFVNNALVFITSFNDLLKEGYSFQEALLQTAQSRFRPILLTSITTVAGLAPLIASNSLSAQFLKGPAIAIAYGLSFGIFNVLILLPAFLIMFNYLRVGWYRLRYKKVPSSETVEPAVKQMQFIVNE